MKTIKTVLVAFVLGGIIGAAGGGYLGYKIGSVNDVIDRANDSEVVEVQKIDRSSKPAVAVENAAEATPEAAAEAAPESAKGGTEGFAITPNDTSEIMWVGYKTILGQKMSMEGGFANFNGNVVVKDNKPDESYVDVTIDIKSIFSVNNILTGVLKGDMFFDADNYPEAKFESSKIEATDDGYMVTGNLTMRGTTKGIQFPAKIVRQGDNVYVEAEFKINRKDWNIGYDSFEDAIVLEDVVLSFKILAEPTEDAPAESAPREVKPAEAVPAETAPTAEKPAEVAPTETAQAEEKSAEAAPAKEEGLDEWLEAPVKTVSQQPVI